MPSATLPSELFMPPEHHPHERTLTAWPDQSSQPDAATLAGAERDVAAISQAIARFEPVTLYCRPENISRAEETLKSTAASTTIHSSSAKHALEIRPLAIDELWIRDTGPVYVHADHPTNGRALVGLDLNFNCWGNKYSDGNNGVKADVDKHVASLILADQSHPRIVAPFTAEGGALEVDSRSGGGGTLLVTESSILNANRNPGVSKAELEARLKAALGVAKVIWLPGVKERDITDGHVDGLARFVGGVEMETEEVVVVLSRPHANADKDAWEVFEEARRVLVNERDARGRELIVVEVGEADPSVFASVDEYQLCLSYVNYLVVNGGVVMPAFGDVESDEKALQAMRKLFPGRKIEQVLLTTICRLGGGIHCATQQVPRL